MAARERWADFAGFEDRSKGPRLRKGEQLLDTGKDKNTRSPLSLQKGIHAADTLILGQ